MTTGVRRAVRLFSLLGVLLLCASSYSLASEQELSVSVAANFLLPAKKIAMEFSRESAIKVRLSSGSTGKLYAQIRHGAPYDLFLAADARRPRMLEEAGLAVSGSRFTYAVGRLALWSLDAGLVEGGATLIKGRFQHLALANPKTAPYGRAAVEALNHLGLYERLRPQLVYGENIGQAFQFVASGNAELGLISVAQITTTAFRESGSRFLIPEGWHGPLDQQAVILASGNIEVARRFSAFLKGERSQAIIAGFGYGSMSR